MLFRNDGENRYPEIGFVSGCGVKEDSRSFVLGDFDDDGDLDIVSNSLNTTAKYLRNEIGAKNNWLTVKLRGVTSNRDGVGARLWIESGGKSQMREFHLGYSYLSQGHGLRNYFGIGKAKTIDKLRIRWPSGVEDVLEDLPANRVMTVKEGSHPASVAKKDDITASY